MQQELPPSSSAWCWQTLKFITLVVCCAEEREGGGGRGAMLERDDDNEHRKRERVKVNHTGVAGFVF